MTDRRQIGFTAASTTVPVDAWRVKLFCQAVGETDPVCWSEPEHHAPVHVGDRVEVSRELIDIVDKKGGAIALIVVDPRNRIGVMLVASHNPLHLDADSARWAGIEQPVVPGMFTMANAARLFTQAIGAGRLRALQARFTGVALLGDTLLFEATLLDQTTGHYSLSAHTDGDTQLVSGNARAALS